MTDNFKCQKTGNCCREYYAIFTEDDVTRISKFLDLTSIEFKDKYITVADTGINVINDLPCAFLKDNLCSIHEVKPEVCRIHPNQDSYEGFSNICPASRVVLKAQSVGDPK